MGKSTVSQGATRVEKRQKEQKPLIPKVIVYFRPLDRNQGQYKQYDGEFGFDWLRTGIPNNTDLRYKKYEEILVAGYNKNHSTENADLSKEDAYGGFKREYKMASISKFGIYRMPYLNIFSKAYSDTITVNITPKPPYKAILKLWLKIENADVDKIIIESNNENLTINDKKEFTLSDTNQCSLKASDIITITCLEDLTKDEEISVYAYPIECRDKSEEEQKKERILAGKLLVCKNDKTVRKTAKFVFVRVKTKLTTEKIGTFIKEEEIRLRNTLYQSLVRPSIWIRRKNNNGVYEDIILDLSNDTFFKQNYMNSIGKIDPNKFAVQDANGNWTFPIFSYLKGKLMNDPIYSGYIPIFAFGEDTNSSTLARAESIGSPKSCALFKGARYKTTFRGGKPEQVVAHEVLHGLGLRHTHRDGSGLLDDKRQKYVFLHGQTYSNKATDNIMSYNMNQMITTWAWQWKIIREHI